MTDSSKTTQQAQTSQTSPWAAAMPLVNNLISGYGGLDPSVTAAQGGALTNLVNATSNLPNFGGQGASAINSMFSSSNAPQVGMLQDAYGSLKNNLGATASGANLNPYDTPGFADAIRTMIQDTTDKTKGVYAGSGRDPSGAGSFAQSLGRGITSGVAPTIAGQYNTNYGNMIGANNSLFSGAGTTASGINNLNQTDMTNRLAGIQASGSIPGLYTSPAMAQYAAANAQFSQPFQNWAQLLQPSVALAGLGSNSSGTGNSTQTTQGSLAGTILGGASGIAGLLGTTGAFGNSGWLTGQSTQGTGYGAAGDMSYPAFGNNGGLLSQWSDERLKTDIVPVGKLNDGQNVYSYKYRGSDVPQIGLLAQEVERVHPEAVGEVGGYKTVRYDIATRNARVGALREAA